MDFTVKIYKELLAALIDQKYQFQTFAEFITNPAEKAIVLRHDVDAKKQNSLLFAQIQAESGVKGTYYFRVVPQSYDEEVICEIATLGHEIGYHYETMDTSRGDIDKAYGEFCENLEMFRKNFPVTTICMHGSPMSKYDNKDIWKKYNYKKLGLIAEPYFDINFNEVGYLTDTGRRWDGEKVSVRDKVDKNNEYRKSSIENLTSTQHPTPNTQHLSSSPVPRASYHTTNDIITAANNKQLPCQLMITFHPQRWTDSALPWIKELVWQNFKNQIKRLLIK